MSDGKRKMTPQARSILGLHNWLLLPFSIVICAMAFAATGLEVDFWSVIPALSIAVIVASVWVFYATKRPDDVICGMLEAFLFFVVIGPPLSLMGYPLQAFALPLWDVEFAAMDAAIGFDWINHLTWVSSSPFISASLVYAYGSCMIQLACVIMLLSFARRFDRIRELLSLFVITALIVSVVSTLMPAEGAYPFHQPADNILIWGERIIGTMHVEHVRQLRSGQFSVVDLGDLKGLVTLPSFHAIFAILLAWSVRDFRWLFIPAAIWNAVVCISAIAVGGHYIVDIFAGAAIAAVAMYGYQARWLTRLLERRAPAGLAINHASQETAPL